MFVGLIFEDDIFFSFQEVEECREVVLYRLEEEVEVVF